MRRAIELGAQAIEIDVRMCEGEIVVIHDGKVDRTTNGRGWVGRKTFAALRKLDAGKGEQIPTLAEVFDAVDRRAWVNVELKGRGTAGPVTKLIDEYVHARGWSYDDFLVSSFNRKELQQLAGTPIPLGILFARQPRGFAKLAARLGATSINIHLRRATRKLIARIQESGLRVFVYTVNEPKDIARIRANGADGIFTDFPDRCRIT